MNYKNFVIGKLYKIKFYDHSIGSKELMECETVGWLQENDQKSILLTYWVCLSEDEDTRKENIEPVRIIKSTIISVRKLL